MNEWLYVGLFFIVGLIIPVGAIGVAWILGPKKPNPIKQSTYECGIEPVGEGWVQFKAQYYIFALVFLVFDVETVFLFPWAVKLGSVGHVCGCGRHCLHPYPNCRSRLHLAQRDVGVGIIFSLNKIKG